MNDAKRIKELLRERVSELAQFLFPSGKRDGANWCVGDITGAPGRSFKVCIAGDKTGLWGDFADSGKHSRNLIDLWMRARNVDFPTALREATEWCAQWSHGPNGTASGPIPSCSRSQLSQPGKAAFEWPECVQAFGEKDMEQLATERGYSLETCSFLKQSGLVGRYNGHIAFPVHNEVGTVVGAHYRPRQGRDWFYTPGIKVHPLVIGELIPGEPLHVFESYWDAIDFLDKSGEKNGIVITRDAGNGALASDLIPKSSTVYLWTQNDPAGKKWQRDICTDTGAVVRRVKIPLGHKDLNDWTRNGATVEELNAALTSAELIPAVKVIAIELDALGQEMPVGHLSNSLNSRFLPFESRDDYPAALDSAAFHGLAGQIVRRIEPHTEADPAALLIQLLTAFGNVIGHNQYIVADGARHYLNLYAVLVGQSSKGRKGTAWNQTANVMAHVDSEWKQDRVTHGLSSGEGLIWAVRDPIEETKPIREKGRHTGDYETLIADLGEDDKRLLIIESEFANVLKVMAREGNTLSPIIRTAWDYGDLRTMVKHSPAKAMGAHISIVGHITRDELRRLLTQTESANGFANRFLWLAVKRSKCLPDGGAIHTVNFNDVVAELQSAVSFTKDFVEITRDPEARKLWHAVYPCLSEGQPGMSGAIIGRAEAQVMRLSAVYALLDKSRSIRPEHHEAAMALWRYCDQSVRWIFGTSTGDRNADKILTALRHSPSGMTKTEISGDVFNRHASSSEIDEALRLLHGLKMVNHKMEATTGAPTQRWFFTAENREISE